MTRGLAIVVLVCGVSVAGVANRQVPTPQAALSIPESRVTADSPVLRLSSKVNPDDCQMKTYVAGPFGGRGAFGARVDSRDIAIAATVGEARARSVKAILYCKEMGIELVEIAPVPPDRVIIPVQFSSLASIPLQGTVSFRTPLAAGRPVSLKLWYLVDWAHDYFGIIDGMVPMFDLGTHRLQPDGTFDIRVPDFANAPALARFTARGTFRIHAIDPETLNTTHWLSTSPDDPGLLSGIPVGWSYPYLRLHAKPARDASF